MKFECSRSAMNGRAISIARKIAMIFGTKTNVVSWICVSACSSEMMTPTISPTSIRGADTRSSVTIASRATSITSGPVNILILSPPPSRRPRAAADGGPAETISDLHLQDVFVGRDHLVAHRDERLHRGFGFGDGGDDVDHIGLAVGDGPRLHVRFLRRLGDVIDDVFEDGAEIWAGALRRAEPAGDA